MDDPTMRDQIADTLADRDTDIAEAMDALLMSPMGVVPKEADKFYDASTGQFRASLIAGDTK